MTLEFNGTCNAIQAVSASEVWIGCGKGKVWHTSDGGQQWQTFTLSPDGGEISDIDVAGTTVWASNTLSEVHRGSGCVGTDLSSCTWSRIEFDGSDLYPQGSAPLLRAIAAVSDTTAWVAGDFGEWTNYGCWAQILKTTDGGASWQKQDSSIGTWAGGDCNQKGIVGIDAIDENNAVALSAGGLYEKTIDGGLSWNFAKGYGPGERFGSVKMIDAMNVWVQYGRFIYRTTTGGEGDSAWGGVGLQGMQTNSIYDLDAVGMETAVVVGEYGKIFRTTNGSATHEANWIEVTSPLPNSSSSTIFAVSILDGDDTGWAIGQSGDAMKVLRK